MLYYVTREPIWWLLISMTNNLWLTSFPRNEFLLGFGVFLGFVWSESEEPVETGFWLVLVWLKMVWSNPEEPAVFLDPDWSRGISIWSIDDDVIDGSDFRREPPHDGAWGLNRPKSSRSFKSEIRNRSILPICDDVITKMRISDHMIQKSIVWVEIMWSKMITIRNTLSCTKSF